MKNIILESVRFSIGSMSAFTDSDIGTGGSGKVKVKNIDGASDCITLREVSDNAAKLGEKLTSALEDSELIIIPVPHGSDDGQRACAVASAAAAMLKQNALATIPRDDNGRMQRTPGKSSSDIARNLLSLLGMTGEMFRGGIIDPSDLNKG